jgi:hypothetical protein
MTRYGKMALYGLLAACGVCNAQQPGPSPTPEQFQRFVTRMVERLPKAELERIGLPEACTAYDGSAVCPWQGFYSQGFDICRALRLGWSRHCIEKLTLAESGKSFKESWIDTSVEVICPDALSAADRTPQPVTAPASSGGATQDGRQPPPARERAFIDGMIERLPADTRDCYRETCRTYDQERCPLWGMSSLGDAVCDAFASGRSRQQVLEGSQGFYSDEELSAIVDTAVEVICPQYRNR